MTATVDDSALVQALDEARERTLALVAPFSANDLERVHSTLMSPLVWDLGHIAAFEDLWLVHRHGGRPLLREDLADVYDAFETPRARRGALPFLRTEQARQYLADVRGRSREVLGERGAGDGVIAELILRHEQQHNETMLQAIQLAQLPGLGSADLRPATPATHHTGLGGADLPPATPTTHHTGLEMVEIPGGECTVGAPPEGFAYDNERPRHRTDVRRYLIGRTPITNATWLTFVQGGGYERREWWSHEGWAWKEEHDIGRPQSWTIDLSWEWRLSGWEPLHPDRPVVHVSWFEADAFARAHGARLPTEAEWEKAATWDPEQRTARAHPWGDDAPVPGVHANLDRHAGGPAPAGAHDTGASPYGCLGMIGDVWEWTSTTFGGYPGFTAHPYREYSEVFFGGGYRVLRGGSWATRPRLAAATFRNWDLPQRRQIFAGVRIARDR